MTTQSGQEYETIKLTITPRASTSGVEIKAQLPDLMDQALQEAARQGLLQNGQARYDIEQTLDPAIVHVTVEVIKIVAPPVLTFLLYYLRQMIDASIEEWRQQQQVKKQILRPGQ